MERKNKEALEKLEDILKNMGLYISETANSGAKIFILGVQGSSIKIEIRISLTNDIIIDEIKADGVIPISQLINILETLNTEIRKLI